MKDPQIIIDEYGYGRYQKPGKAFGQWITAIFALFFLAIALQCAAGPAPEQPKNPAPTDKAAAPADCRYP
jgi:hypothetical protein